MPDAPLAQPGATHTERITPDAGATVPDHLQPPRPTEPATSVRWYQDPSKVVGVLGFVLAFGTLGERMWVRHQEEVDLELQRLRETTVKLADIQGEFIELVLRAPTNFYARSAVLNTKRQMHMQTAIALLASDAVKAQASAQILATLGAEISSDGRYKEAKDFYEAALKAPGLDDTTEVALRRSLGQLYRVPNTAFTNVALSRQYYQEAHAKLDKRNDDAGYIMWAEGVLNEAGVEVAVGDRRRASELAAKARERLSLVKTISPQKTQLEILASAYERGEQFAQSQMSSLPTPQLTTTRSSTPLPSTEAPTDVRLELWSPVPGQTPGAEIEISIDGQALGQLSNLIDKRSVTVPLSTGFHRFSLSNMKAYLIDGTSAPRLIAHDLACSGAFEVTANATVLKINAGAGPNGTICSVQ